MGYVVASAWMARRFRLRDPGVERLSIELPTLGHKIGLTRYSPTQQKYREPVLLCHGLGANRFNMDFFQDGHGSDRLSLARTLMARGFDVWVLELRGRGQAVVPKGADWNVDDELREDVPVAIETVLALTGAQQLMWVGHSKGALLQILFQASRHPLADRVRALVAIAGPGRFRLGILARVARGAERVFRRRSVPLILLARVILPLTWFLGLGGRRLYADLRNFDIATLRHLLASLPADIAPGVLRQFAHWIRHDRLTKTASSEEEADFVAIRLPCLFMAGTRDVLATPAAVGHVAERVSSTDLECALFGRAMGHRAEYGHGDLLLGRHAPDEVFPIVIRWLMARATPQPDLSPGADSDGNRAA